MKYNFLLLISCINLSLLPLFIARSEGGVGSLCQDGKFFDQSKKRSVPCHECKKETEECFSCCKTDSDNQVERNNATNPSQVNSYPQPQEASGHVQRKQDLSERSDFLPNTLVVSIVGFFVLISLLVPILVIVKRCTRRGGHWPENDQTSNESQRSGIATVMVMESISDSADTSAETAE